MIWLLSASFKGFLTLNLGMPIPSLVREGKLLKELILEGLYCIEGQALVRKYDLKDQKSFWQESNISSIDKMSIALPKLECLMHSTDSSDQSILTLPISCRSPGFCSEIISHFPTNTAYNLELTILLGRCARHYCRELSMEPF